MLLIVWLLICLNLTLSTRVVIAQFKPFHACQVRPCYEQSLLTCALRDQPWAALLYNGRPVCVCCSDERDARIAAGSNVMSGKGLFWGNRLKVCETVYIDEITCQARQLRDCNYQTIVYKGTFVGCFYCRALCGTSADCRDLGRSCGLSKRYQPVRSCTFTPYAVADYDYDQGGLGGLGGVGNTGLGTGLGAGLANGLSSGINGGSVSSLGVLTGINENAMMSSDANNLLYIKENANNFSASFYMDEELRDQLVSILKHSNQTSPNSTVLLDLTESSAPSSLITDGLESKGSMENKNYSISNSVCDQLKEVQSSPNPISISNVTSSKSITITNSSSSSFESITSVPSVILKVLKESTSN